MLFSKQKPIDSKESKRRSTLGSLLSPDFGASIRPIGESTRIFVNLIAMLFAMNGLFPKDHPAFAEGSTVRLTLHQVIATAWSNLTFTEKDMPKVLFFLAVVSCMVITVFAVIIGIFSLFVGTAHAQGATSAFFTPPAGDLAQNWIDYMFQGKALLPAYNQAGAQDIPQVTSVGNTVGSINIQCAMITALGFYSDAVLMVAALILFYHLAAMVVETAHHGVVMGKRANQIWAPIRLVVAVGLLVPIGNGGTSSCPNGGSAGLNSAQYITIKIAELGSALASNTWTTFIHALGASQFNFIQPSTPAVDKIVEDIFLMEGCMAAWNHYNTTDMSPGGAGPNQIQVLTVSDSQVNTGQFWDFAEGNPPIADGGLHRCGYIFLPSPPQNSANDTSSDQLSTSGISLKTQLLQQIAAVHKNVLTTMIPEIQNFVAQDIIYVVPAWNGQHTDGPPPDNTDFRQAVTDYATQLNQGLTNVFNSQAASTNLNQDVITSIGWIGAGAWMNTIARDQGALVFATYDGLPVTQAPRFGNYDNPLVDSTKYALWQFKTWMSKASTSTDLSNAPGPCNLQGATGQAGLATGENKVGDDAIGTPLEQILRFIDTEAQKAGLWNDPNYSCPAQTNGQGQNLFTLGTQFTSGNPLGELAAYGQKNMRLAFSTLDDMFLAMGVSTLGAALENLTAGLTKDSTTRTKAISDFGGAIGGFAQGAGNAGATIFGFLALVFLTTGVTLAYVVPLIPFIHFFFAAIAWGLVLLEAIVAMPLVALAHLNPEGDGLPGGMAKQAYFMLLGLFLRPVLIIFGFIVSLLTFMLSMFLLNKLYAVTVVGTGGLNAGYATVSRIIFTVIYVFITYSCVTSCFKIVDQLPEAVFRWISINIQHQRMADGGSVLQGAAGPITALAAQQGIGAIQGAAGSVREGISKVAGGAGAGVKDLISPPGPTGGFR